jgi:hypothetical protein
LLLLLLCLRSLRHGLSSSIHALCRKTGEDEREAVEHASLNALS